jgi:hypothetical protein
MRSAVIGKDAATACDSCGEEIKYHIDESALPIADELKKINQHIRDRRQRLFEN